jgi:ABC-type multidrug transport system fused ATPase/permease subunit
MAVNVKSLLKDQNVLRVVAFMAVVNLLGYVMIRDVDSVAFFVVVGFLTTYFSKNMIIVLLVTMLLTNLVVVINKTQKHKNKEGFGGKGSGRKHSKLVQDSSLDNPNGVDQEATVEKAYENLENMLGTDAINKMSTDTQKLSKRQKKLQQQIQTLQPVLKNSFALLDQMGGAKGVEGMINQVGGMLDKVGSLTGGFMKPK